jgi:hypothetical protein
VLGDCSEIYVDAFPAGVLGELCGLTGHLRAHHVARRLRWGVYARRLRGALPRFERTYVLEPLEPAHSAALTATSVEVETLELASPAAPPAAPPFDRRTWLVVHSGPEAEVADLVRRAANERPPEARIVVASPTPPARLPENAVAIDHYPAASLYPHVERIFTACGFNAMRETAPYRDRHTFVPYGRALDDQFWRAAASA